MKDHRAEVVELEIFPHNNADRLEIAQPIGTDWFVVVGKGEFVTGDLGIYIPIDSVVPNEFIQKYLANSKIKLSNNRIKSIKIRGAVSQGLIIRPEPSHQLGEDVTDELGIKKYEPPNPKWYREQPYVKTPRKMRKFISFVNDKFPKYTKISNHKYHKNAMENQEVVLTEKIHGTNFRAGTVHIGDFKYPWYKELWYKLTGKKPQWQFVVGSHNVTKWHEDKIYWRAAKEAGLDKLGPEWNGFIFYGEIYGFGIQELAYGTNPGEIRLAIFDILWTNEYGQMSYLPWAEVKRICKSLNLHHVPELYIGPWSDGLISKYADGKSIMPNANHHREGFVVKPTTESFHPNVGRLILKRISDVYLLSKGNKTDYH